MSLLSPHCFQIAVAGASPVFKSGTRKKNNSLTARVLAKLSDASLTPSITTPPSPSAESDVCIPMPDMHPTKIDAVDGVATTDKFKKQRPLFKQDPEDEYSATITFRDHLLSWDSSLCETRTILNFRHT